MSETAKIEAPDRETLEASLTLVRSAIDTYQSMVDEERKLMELTGRCSAVPDAHLRLAWATHTLLRNALSAMEATDAA